MSSIFLPKEYRITFAAAVILLTKFSNKKNPLIVFYVTQEKSIFLIKEGEYAGCMIFDHKKNLAQAICPKWTIYIEEVYNKKQEEQDIEKYDIVIAQDMEVFE